LTTRSSLVATIEVGDRTHSELALTERDRHFGISFEYAPDGAAAVDPSLRFEADVAERLEQFRAIFQTALDGFWLVETTGRLLDVNDAYCRMTGYTREELLSKAIADIEARETPDETARHIERIIAVGSDFFESKHRRKDGSTIDVEVSVRYLPIGQGSIFAIFRDVTERKRMERQIRAYQGELTGLVERRASRIQELERQRSAIEKAAATGRLAARLAHEINNPLAGIRNSFLLVKDAIPEIHPYFPYVGMIEKEIARLAAIVREMYGIFRPDGERPAEFDLSRAVREVAALLDGLRLKARVTVCVESEPDPLTVVLHETSLRQVLFNLLQNAIEASPAGGTVRVAAHAGDDTVELRVTDDGPGVPEAVRSRIFEPFFTTKSASEATGLGLGLSICANLVLAMQGEISLAPGSPGTGATVRVRLPLRLERKESGTDDGRGTDPSRG
jgi:PAS domain S-box-containing protein